MRELFEKVVIKSEADLPKETGYYKAMDKSTDEFREIYFAEDISVKGWLSMVEYWLRPVEQPTDEDILEWAYKETPIQSTFQLAYLHGAKAMRDGNINKSES